MTHEQKRALREHHSVHPTLTQEQLAEWAESAFKLPRRPSRMTLFRVLREPAGVHDAMFSRKTNQRVQSPELEAELLVWIHRCEEYKLPVVTGASIQEKAAKIRDRLANTAAPSTADVLRSMVFSHGWLFKFQLRHNLTSKRTHGEAASVRTAAVEEGRIVLQEVTRGYDKCNIFNMDETAFFYCAAPEKTISTNRMSGRKQVKKRLTVAVCCNADGSTKRPLLFVGAVRRPRCFGKQTAEELGLYYESTARGWMNSQLFQSWAERLNDDMKEENRRVLLLVDNVFSHRLDAALSNVKLQMLPPNTTSFLQPQDAGIINAFKAKINRLKQRHIVDRFDDMLSHIAEVGEESAERDIDALLKVDVLVAMKWAQEAWEEVSRSTIANCWRHTKILDEDVFELVESIEKLRVGAPAPGQLLNQL